MYVKEPIGEIMENDAEVYIGRFVNLEDGKPKPSTWTEGLMKEHEGEYVDCVYEHGNEDLTSSETKYPVVGRAKVVGDGLCRIDFFDNYLGETGKMAVDFKIADKLSLQERVEWDERDPSGTLKKKILHIALVKDPGRGDGMFIQRLSKEEIQKLGKDEYKQIRSHAISASNSEGLPVMSDQNTTLNTEPATQQPPAETTQQTVPSTEEDIEGFIAQKVSDVDQAARMLELLEARKRSLIQPVEEEKKRIEEERKRIEEEKKVVEEARKQAEELRKHAEEETKKHKAMLENMTSVSRKRAVEFMSADGKNKDFTPEVQKLIEENPTLQAAIISACSHGYKQSGAIDAQFERDETDAKRQRLQEMAARNRQIGGQYSAAANRLEQPRSAPAPAVAPMQSVSQSQLRQFMQGSAKPLTSAAPRQ